MEVNACANLGSSSKPPKPELGCALHQSQVSQPWHSLLTFFQVILRCAGLSCASQDVWRLAWMPGAPPAVAKCPPGTKSPRLRTTVLEVRQKRNRKYPEVYRIDSEAVSHLGEPSSLQSDCGKNAVTPNCSPDRWAQTVGDFRTKHATPDA